jgi:rod shape-determining protein MreC
MLENARLRSELESLKARSREPWKASSARVLRTPGWNGSPWMVLGCGGRDGAMPGSGILSLGFAAGKIVDTTAHESLVLSLAHPKAQWSVRMGQRGQAGRLVAREGEVRTALVKDIPWAQLVLPGDTVMTTGFDGVFPPDIPVGVVEDVLGTEADEFQTAVVSLGANYPASRHVIWLNQGRQSRIDSLSNSSNLAP